MITERLAVFRDGHQLVRHLSDAARGERFVLVAGNFDGMHLGHQALLQRAQMLAANFDAQVLIFLGEPPFREAVQRKQGLRGKQPAQRIMSPTDKLEYLAGADVRWVWMQRTTDDFMRLSGAEFAATFLEKMPLAGMVVGHDYHYGANRDGNAETLHTWGERNDVYIDVVDPQMIGGIRFSSTMLRSHIATGEFMLASLALGRMWRFTRRVSYGRQLGRTLGFPTANLAVPQNTCLSGVYAADITIDGDVYGGVVNVGSRPTVAGVGIVAEVHVFDYSGDLYGQRIAVAPVAKLRDEKKFSGLPELKQAIAADCDAARAALAENVWRHAFASIFS